MAKVPNAPDSATSQWFINLADNGGLPNNLDSENGGYTTFGNVVAGFDTLLAIAGYTAWDASSIDAAWGSLPLIPAFDNNRPACKSDFVTITNAHEIAPEPATMALLAMGGGLALLGRRRGRK
jgi:peptidyl-prolyl cis-trans isomerase A (cyclophilin A)